MEADGVERQRHRVNSRHQLRGGKEKRNYTLCPAPCRDRSHLTGQTMSPCNIQKDERHRRKLDSEATEQADAADLGHGYGALDSDWTPAASWDLNWAPTQRRSCAPKERPESIGLCSLATVFLQHSDARGEMVSESLPSRDDTGNSDFSLPW